MVVRKIERHRQEERHKEVKKACREKDRNSERPSGRSNSQRHFLHLLFLGWFIGKNGVMKLRSWQDSLDSSCACVLSGILGISLKKTKSVSVWDRREGGDGKDQFELMLTALCFNDRKHRISLHSPSSSLSGTKQVRYRNWQSKGAAVFPCN